MTVDTNNLRYLPKQSSKNCDMQFANSDRQTDLQRIIVYMYRYLHLFKTFLGGVLCRAGNYYVLH